MVVMVTPGLLIVEFTDGGNSNNTSGVSHAELGAQKINRQIARYKSKIIS